MSSVSPRKLFVIRSEQPNVLCYTSFPLREHWLSWLVLAAVVSLAYVLILATGTASGLTVTAALAFTLRRFWAPTHCEIDFRGVGIGLWKIRHRVSWAEIADYRVGLHGVVLFPSAPLTLYDSAFGLYLPFAHRQSEVLSMIEQKVRRPA